MLSHCPLCRSPRLHYALSRGSQRIVRCSDCRLLFLNPQRGADGVDGAGVEPRRAPAPRAETQGESERATARHHLDELQRYRGRRGGRLLHVGFGESALSLEAEGLGYAVTHGVLPAADGGEAAMLPALGQGAAEGVAPGADVCAVVDAIENVGRPVEFLRGLRPMLRPGGVLFLSTPEAEDRLGRHAGQVPPRRYFYFDALTLWNLMYCAGYEHVLVFPRRRLVDLDEMSEHLRSRWPALAGLVAPFGRLLPEDLRQRRHAVAGDGLVAFATVAAEPACRTLSVIVPAYNERSTFEALMERLLQKEIPGLAVEIIVVESNSNDGTRELAQRYADRPRVSLILEDRPRGKGHAVRAGLEQARGDLILIQDADLEYDIEDYDVLLEPLLARRTLFVLGARHGGQAWWKMRRFAEAPLLSFTMNAGHRFFTALVNRLFGLRLRDPFTMFKVFWRDCLFGLEFQRNRFDFDYELLIKLARKGCVPIEVPVNYRSRSYAEGKKVSLWRDPLTWLRALAELRVERLQLLENAGRVHRQSAGGDEPRG